MKEIVCIDVTENIPAHWLEEEYIDIWHLSLNITNENKRNKLSLILIINLDTFIYIVK